MIGDKLLGRFSFDQAGNYSFYSGMLESYEAFNELIQEIWFAETITIILLPLILILVNKKSNTKLLFTCVIAAIVMIFGVIDRFETFRQEFKNTMPDAYAIHTGASYFPLYEDSIDPTLQSVAPYFLRAQIPILIGVAVGYTGYSIYENRKSNN